MHQKSFEITGLDPDDGHRFLVLPERLRVKQLGNLFFDRRKKALERLGGPDLPDPFLTGTYTS